MINDVIVVLNGS